MLSDIREHELSFEGIKNDYTGNLNNGKSNPSSTTKSGTNNKSSSPTITRPFTSPNVSRVPSLESTPNRKSPQRRSPGRHTPDRLSLEQPSSPYSTAANSPKHDIRSITADSIRKPSTPPLTRASITSARIRRLSTPIDTTTNNNTGTNTDTNGTNYSNDKLLNELIDQVIIKAKRLRFKSNNLFKTVASKTSKKEQEYKGIIITIIIIIIIVIVIIT